MKPTFPLAPLAGSGFRTYLSVLLFAFAAASSAAYEIRTWTSLSGKTLEARLVECKDMRVVMEMAGARSIAVNLADLSMEDRLYLHDQGALPPDMLVRRWTSTGGKEVLAMLLGVSGDTVVLDLGGRRFPVELSRLSPDDREAVRAWLEEREKEKLRLAEERKRLEAERKRKEAEARAGMMNVPFLQVKPGQVQKFTIPLPERWTETLTRTGYPAFASIDAVISTPPGFHPAERWPVLVVHITSSGKGRNVDHARSYTRAANQNGWVVLAASGPDHEADDSLIRRWIYVDSVLTALEEYWPDIKSWGYACGGFSGGAKWSGRYAAVLLAEGYDVIGMFMGGCNQDYATRGLVEIRPDKGLFLDVPIYLSNGKTDKLTGPGWTNSVLSSFENTGFKKVRVNMYDGGHRLHQEDVDTALVWFKEEWMGKAATPEPEPVNRPKLPPRRSRAATPTQIDWISRLL